MTLFKKFLVLNFLPTIILLGIYFSTKNEVNEFRDVFVTLFSIGFFVLIAFNSVYVSDYLKKWNFKFFSKLLLVGFITFISIASFSFILNIILRDSNFRLAVIFPQAFLGFCIFLLEYLVLYVLEKKNTLLLKFDDKNYHYVILILYVVFIEYLLYMIMVYKDINDLFEFLWLNRFILIFMFTVSFVSFLMIRLFNYLKFGGLLNVISSSIISFLTTFWILVLLVFGENKFSNNRFGVLLIIYLISLFSTLSIYVIVFFRNQLNEKRKLKHQNIQKEAQYLELKNQINPHFLFNNLNTLISFIEDNPQKAIDFGHNLSNVYRHYLHNQTDEFVNLKNELNFIKEYLEIYKAKFENGFTFITPNEVDSNTYILSFSIQEIIDNIFKHNCLDEDNPLIIRIFIEDDLLVISNSILPKKVDSSNNIGLDNINKRYELLVNRSIVVETIENVFVIKLPILDIES